MHGQALLSRCINPSAHECMCVMHRHQLDIITERGITEFHVTDGYKLGNYEYLHTQISILVHSEHCLRTICTLRSCDIYAFDSEHNIGYWNT